MPNITFPSEDVIPEGLKEFTKKEGEVWVVNVVPETKLAEFRNNNIALSQERDGLKAVVTKLAPVVGEDLDGFLTKYTDLSAIAQKVADGKLKTSDAIETEVIARVAQVKTGFETQITTLNQEKAAALQAAGRSDAKYRRSIIDRAITDAVISPASGANPEALSHIIRTAYDTFVVTDDDKLLAKNGDAILYSDNDGTTPLSPAEWLAKLRTKAPYFFKQSGGGGSTGGNTTGNAAMGGMSAQDFNKLSPEQRLAIYHKNNSLNKKAA
jgi:hypothetical protein